MVVVMEEVKRALLLRLVLQLVMRGIGVIRVVRCVLHPRPVPRRPGPGWLWCGIVRYGVVWYGWLICSGNTTGMVRVVHRLTVTLCSLS